jgi:hypothetical protein
MKVPNGVPCVISWDRDRSLVSVVRALRMCSKELASAYADNKPLFFSLASSEARVLRLHVEQGESTSDKLCDFLNEALKSATLPYRFHRGLGEVNGNMYAYRVMKA